MTNQLCGLDRPDLQPALELPVAQPQNQRVGLVSAFYRLQYPLAHSTLRESGGLAELCQLEHGMRGGVIF